MKFVIVSAFFCLLILPLSGFCEEYYKYVDENGVIHFVEDLSRIPNASKNNIEIRANGTSSQQMSYSENENNNADSDSKRAAEIINKINELEAKKENAYRQIEQLKIMRENTERNAAEVLQKLNSR